MITVSENTLQEEVTYNTTRVNKVCHAIIWFDAVSMFFQRFVGAGERHLGIIIIILAPPFGIIDLLFK